MHQVEEQPPPRGATSAAISNAVVRLLAEYTGRGPTKARTTISRDLVAVVLHDTMTRGERTLAAAGKEDFVLEVRHQYQWAMREDLVGAIEMLMERKVLAFMSDNHIDPDLAVEIFVLEPVDAGESGTQQSSPE